MRHDRVLGPAVAGRWYPRNRDELAGVVDGLLDSAAGRAVALPGPVTALVAPHAGFEYSGAVAASGFVKLRGSRVDRIVLVGPSHHFGFSGAAIPGEATAYRTPLGDVPVDRDAVAALRETAGFQANDAWFAPEHALEAELPFLQRVLPPETPIVPVLLGGRTTYDDTRRIASALEPLMHGASLLVISSDFTHFGPRFGYVPFEDDVPAKLRELDLGAVAHIEAGEGAAFARYVETTGATICGHRAIDVLLSLGRAGAGAKLLEYDTSGRMTGTWDHSVSYAAIAAFAADAGAQ